MSYSSSLNGLAVLRLPLILAGLWSTAGCVDYRFEQQCPERVREANLAIASAEPTPADILFVVDNSGSMADEQENLAANFERFINEIAGSGNYRIAVVTTDQSFGLTDTGEQEGLAQFNFASTSPFNLLSSDVSACRVSPLDPTGDLSVAIPHGCFRGPDPASRIIDSNVLDRDAQIRTFQNNVRVGSCGSGSEQGLNAMISALDQTDPGECNQGFLREEANLVVIIVSDEEDSSCNDCGLSSPPLAPVQDFVGRLGQIKPFSRTRVATIVGSVNGEASTCSVDEGSACGTLCQTPPPDGSLTPCTPGASGQCGAGEFCQRTGATVGQCQNEALRFWNETNCGWCSFFNAPDCCSALAGSRYVQFAQSVENRVNESDSAIPISRCQGAPGTRIACLTDSICQESFGDTLARIARELVLTNSFALDPPATFPPGVRVRLRNGRFGDGTELINGEDFVVSDDGATLTITAGDKTPVEGEEVDIFFVVESGVDQGQLRGACVN